MKKFEIDAEYLTLKEFKDKLKEIDVIPISFNKDTLQVNMYMDRSSKVYINKEDQQFRGEK